MSDGLHKPGRRLLGIDDGPFDRKRGANVLVVGVVCRGDHLDGVLTTHVRKDGWNATDRLVDMILDSKFEAQLHGILLDGITLGGLNVVDLARLAQDTKLPAIAVIRRKPDQGRMEDACGHLANQRRRVAMLRRAGEVYEARHVFFQAHGLDPDEARRVVDSSAIFGYIPEPIRLAHLIAGGVVTGQSGHRA